MASTAVLGTMIATAPQASALGFIGAFSPDNWTPTNTNPDGTIFVTNGAAGNAVLTGGDNNGVQTALGNTNTQTGTASVNFQASAVTTVPWETDSLPIIGSGVLLGFGIFAKRKFAKRPQI